jgi:beta-lactamase regulating signal transducer with metallopeptidase domain
VWLAASLKFLMPFALFSWIGHQFVYRTDSEPALLPLMQYASTPMPAAAISNFALSPAIARLLIALWLAGSLLLLARWVTRWLQCVAIVHRSRAHELHADVPVRSSRELHEPALVGVFKPVLLIPETMTSAFAPAQRAAVVAHEEWHARRRDNLFAAIHTCVEVLFWFHPLVWWIGRKLLAEREMACDEQVVLEGHEPVAYATALIAVGRGAMTKRLCAAGATDGDLPSRVRAILAPRRAHRFSLSHRALLAAAMLVCIGLPVASGMTIISTAGITVTAGARSIQVSNSSQPPIIVGQEGYLYARNVSLRQLISDLYAVNVRNISGSEQWLDQPRYDIELAAATDKPMDSRELLVELLRQRFNIDLVVRPDLVVSSH